MPSANFSRILTLLRKERGITQKEAAASLGVSQALLSHYEKGIRECGLDFVVRAADFYGVSCDYLLGRSPDRNGSTLTVDDLPEDDQSYDKHYRGSVLPVLNKKLLTNSLFILYDLLLRAASSKLVGEVSAYLMTAYYKMFRRVYGANPKNSTNMFSVPDSVYSGYADAQMSRSDAKICAMLEGERLLDIEPEQGVEALTLTTEHLTQEYPQHSSALFNLIKQTERGIMNE